MIITKIDYINLLPFHIFLKNRAGLLIAKSAIRYKKSFPSSINKEFLTRRANLAFISSIASSRSKKTNVGIVAKKDVRSVIALPGEYKSDGESASSNVLARILKINGQILIGDKALKVALRTSDYIDLVKVWHERYNLPFVFAVLCYNKEFRLSKRIARDFVAKKIKIPQTVLDEYARTRQIGKNDILDYLTKISYTIGTKERLGYKKFLDLAKHI